MRLFCRTRPTGSAVNFQTTTKNAVKLSIVLTRENDPAETVEFEEHATEQRINSQVCFYESRRCCGWVMALPVLLDG